MLEPYLSHNLFKKSIALYLKQDPHLLALSQFIYQYSSDWWKALDLKIPGIYILTGGRQIGKSTSCKLLIKQCLQKHFYKPQQICYLPCDEIFDAKELGTKIRYFLEMVDQSSFLLIVDEITYVTHWERVIKALADEGWFNRGICILTGSDTLILKEAAMSFPGRRGLASKTDFHLYPLTFFEFVTLTLKKKNKNFKGNLQDLFLHYLKCGGYLRAINDVAETGAVRPATYQTYEQWIRGDFLKQGKNEEYLLSVLHTLFVVGVTQVTYSALTQKTGLVSKETFIDYCRLLERMDILFNLQAYDQNKKQGFPRKARKFHFMDPFIMQTIYGWLKKNGFMINPDFTATAVESVVASHCYRFARTYYFKGQGEVDIIWLAENKEQAIEVKWTNQLRPADLKMLKHFKHGLILNKQVVQSNVDGMRVLSVAEFLNNIA